MSRQLDRPFDRPRAVWQRYRGHRAAAQYAFWWPHAPLGAFAAGTRLAIGFPEPAIVHWGRDGWQAVADTPTSDTGLGFHVAVLEAAALTPGGRVDFTWRRLDSGEWAGRDIAVRIVSAETAGPPGPSDPAH